MKRKRRVRMGYVESGGIKYSAMNDGRKVFTFVGRKASIAITLDSIDMEELAKGLSDAVKEFGYAVSSVQGKANRILSGMGRDIG